MLLSIRIVACLGNDKLNTSLPSWKDRVERHGLSRLNASRSDPDYCTNCGQYYYALIRTLEEGGREGH